MKSLVKTTGTYYSVYPPNFLLLQGAHALVPEPVAPGHGADGVEQVVQLPAQDDHVCQVGGQIGQSLLKVEEAFQEVFHLKKGIC